MLKMVIVIKLKSGKKRYLGQKLNRRGKPTLVLVGSALIFDREWVAEAMSDWFWQNHWDKELYEWRSFEFLD